jgi:hypothetical protein
MIRVTAVPPPGTLNGEQDQGTISEVCGRQDGMRVRTGGGLTYPGACPPAFFKTSCLPLGKPLERVGCPQTYQQIYPRIGLSTVEFL